MFSNLTDTEILKHFPIVTPWGRQQRRRINYILDEIVVLKDTADKQERIETLYFASREILPEEILEEMDRCFSKAKEDGIYELPLDDKRKYYVILHIWELYRLYEECHA